MVREQGAHTHTLSHSQTAHASPSRKVAFVLAELGLEFESKYLDFGTLEHKGPEYTKYNPNGRIPTLIDHGNNDLVIWYVSMIVHPPLRANCSNHQGV